MAKNDGGPAFPVETDGHGRGRQTSSEAGWELGMSLRDYFAGQVMAGIGAWSPAGASEDDFNIEARASFAYRQADALLKARSE